MASAVKATTVTPTSNPCRSALVSTLTGLVPPAAPPSCQCRPPPVKPERDQRGSTAHAKEQGEKEEQQGSGAQLAVVDIGRHVAHDEEQQGATT